MRIISQISDFHDDMRQWRHHLHANPELEFDCFNTAKFIAERLGEFGVDEIHTGIAKTGIVAIINGHSNGPTIGLRADMDALPIHELNAQPYKSTIDGVMHACGHDGHTAMLLGAARYLCETRNFSGRVALIFQPAEELGGGGKVMCQEGMMGRFSISQVYGIHNMPNVAQGIFQLNKGALLAACDTFEITITGSGGHGANPEGTKDPISAGVNLAQMIQTISSRNLGGLDDAVISVTQFNSGTSKAIIPQSAVIGGTVRTLNKQTQELIQSRFQTLCDGAALSFDQHIQLEYSCDYPATINHPLQAQFAADVAKSIVGETMMQTDTPPIMAAEDFSFMLEERPGAYIFLGQGPGPVLHHPEYDFNDDILPIGASYYATLVEQSSA